MLLGVLARGPLVYIEAGVCVRACACNAAVTARAAPIQTQIQSK